MKLATVLLAALTGGCCAARGFERADHAAVTAVLERQRAAWNRGDLAAYIDGYARTQNLVFTSAGQVRRGWDDTMRRYRTRYGGDRAGMGQLAFEILGVQPLGADGAVVLGRWRLTGTPNAGGGIFSVVLARRPEGWRIVHDHTSRD
jgi:ketosteroid isomerase-like protein